MWTRVALSAAVLLALTACSNSPQGSQLTQQQQSYVGELSKVDGRLAGDQSRSLQLGVEVCAKIAKGMSIEAIAGDSQRFTQGEGVIDKRQAAAVVDAARKNLCPQSTG